MAGKIELFITWFSDIPEKVLGKFNSAEHLQDFVSKNKTWIENKAKQYGRRHNLKKVIVRSSDIGGTYFEQFEVEL